MSINIGADISTIYIGDKAVDKVYVGDKLVYQRQSGEHYLTFSSKNPFSIDPRGGNWNGSMQYSTDAQTWIDWDGSTVSAAQGEDGYYLYLRGTGNTVVTGYIPYSSDRRWILTGTDISCIGNIETLLDYAEVSKGIHPIMGESCFHYMFYNNSALINAPELPSPVLTKLCYAYTFSKTGITTSPELPATTLAESCYRSMFYGCTSLTSCPSLPATNLAESCYNFMFHGCTKIKLSTTLTEEYVNQYRIPTSGTGTTATTALDDMFSNTGGTFKSTPTINKTYYTSNEIVT